MNTQAEHVTTLAFYDTNLVQYTSSKLDVWNCLGLWQYLKAHQWETIASISTSITMTSLWPALPTSPWHHSHYYYQHHHHITLTILNLHGRSDRNTPDSSASTWPPTYVSESRTWPSSDNLFSIDSCLFGNTMFASKAFTISRASHSVPDPFLNT